MALKWYGQYTREEFAELDGADQSRIIALYLINQQVESVISMEHIKAAKRSDGGG